MDVYVLMSPCTSTARTSADIMSARDCSCITTSEQENNAFAARPFRHEAGSRHCFLILLEDRSAPPRAEIAFLEIYGLLQRHYAPYFFNDRTGFAAGRLSAAD